MSKNEKGKWTELAALLAMELEIAAARTNSISNIPAFLTEHLRRRLLRKSENISTENKSSRSRIGKSSEIDKTTDPLESSNQSYEAEPLIAEGRETVMRTMNDYIEKGEKEFVMSLQDSYTAEDWDWLMENVIASDKK